MRLAADQLEAFLHRHDAFHGLRELVEQDFEGLVRQFVADGANHGTRHAAHDVRAVTEPFDLLEHSGFLFPADIRFENDNHGFDLRPRRCDSTKKPQAMTCGAG